jgi:preprotein translocase subunit SecF
MFHQINIRVIQHRRIFYIISAAIIIAGLVNVGIHRGLKMGIDFAGGNVMQVELLNRDVTIAEMRDVLIGTGYGNNVQRIEEPNRNIFILRTLAQERNNDQVIQNIRNALNDRFGAANVEVQRVDIVGPRISKDLLRAAYLIGIVALVLILMYVSFRFRFRFGATAIAALFHDVLVVVAFLSFFGKELDTFVLAAILTIIGYSMNDTIVVFDRARENLKSSRAHEEFETTFNTSINQSFSRTIITSGTTLLALLSLYFFGGNLMRDFAFTLLVGVIAGTYSSIFVASALVVDWHLWRPEKLKKV